MWSVVLLAVFQLCSADITAPTCEDMISFLPADQLNKIYGEWSMVECRADYKEGLDLVVNLTSSYNQFTLGDDNVTVQFHERNRFTGGRCVRYYMNTTVDTGSEFAALNHITYVREASGSQTQRSDPDRIFFYKSFCPDCLTMMYQGETTGTLGRYLMFLRRLGTHQNVEELTAASEINRKQAECLKFEDPRHFLYDGKTEFCPLKEESPEEEKAVES